MTQIGLIIQTVLEENDSKCLDNEEERVVVAEQCEQALLRAIGEQYKALAEQVGITPYQMIAGPLE
tara:strand:+ start:668 stop:865 length:198 start_codon:yes stop_codon:yes gene_type:complete